MKEHKKNSKRSVYKVTLTKVVEVLVEADDEDQALDWARCNTPTEAEVLSENQADVSYDEQVELSNETSYMIRI